MKKKTKKLDIPDKFPLVYIEWIDAESACGWEDREGLDKWINKDFIVNDIGWKVSENDKYVLICNQIASDGDFGNRTRIPKAWIKKLQRVTLTKRKK